MRIIVERDALSDALAAVNARACGKMNIPILECVRIEASGSRLDILAHWMDACCSTEIPADVKAPGAAIVDAMKLAGLVNGFSPGAQVSVELVADHVELRAGRSRYRLASLPLDDFPAALAIDDPIKITLSAKEVVALFQQPEPAVSDEIKTRPYICGIYLHNTPRGLAACATNGASLILSQTNLRAAPFEGILIPRERLSDVRAGVKSGNLDLEISPALLTAIYGNRRYTTKLIDGTFPDYARVIPERQPQAIVVTRTDLLSALQRLRVLLGDRNTITLRWGDAANSLTIVPHDHAAAGEETIDADGGEIAGGEFTTLASALCELLNASPYDEVRLGFSGGSLPVRIDGMSDDALLALTMPRDFGRKAEASQAA